jgi:two-component system KDP operon response regulator KdpE
MKILIIEDSLDIIDAVAQIIELRWPEASFISTTLGETGVEMARREQPDVIVLDLGLPDIDGFQVLHKIRSFSNVPVLILTVREEEIDKIRGLELGADDYMVKPFLPGEFLARVRAVHRRREIPKVKDYTDEKTFIRGSLRVDFVSREVSIGDKLLKLSPTQYEILHELVVNENKVVSKQKLFKKIRGPKQTTNIEYLDVCVEVLKEMLEREPGHRISIVKENEKGYKLANR